MSVHPGSLPAKMVLRQTGRSEVCDAAHSGPTSCRATRGGGYGCLKSTQPRAAAPYLKRYMDQCIPNSKFTVGGNSFLTDFHFDFVIQ
jgi:hypothetical protein